MPEKYHAPIKTLNMENERNICRCKIHLRYQTEIDVMLFPPLPSFKKYFFVRGLFGELVPSPGKLLVKKDFSPPSPPPLHPPPQDQITHCVMSKAADPE